MSIRSIRINDDEWSKMKELSIQNGCSVSELLRRSVFVHTNVHTTSADVHTNNEVAYANDKASGSKARGASSQRMNYSESTFSAINERASVRGMPDDDFVKYLLELYDKMVGRKFLNP